MRCARSWQGCQDRSSALSEEKTGCPQQATLKVLYKAVFVSAQRAIKGSPVSGLEKENPISSRREKRLSGGHRSA